MKTIKFIIMTAVAACGLSMQAGAQDLESLNYPATTRSLAMGGTEMASKADGTTIMANPAAMALMNNRLLVQANYMGIRPDSQMRNFGNAAAAFSFGRHRFAVSVYGQYSSGTRHIESDIMGNPLGYFTPYEYTVGAGFAARIIKGLAIGVNAKMISAVRMSDRWLASYPDYANAYAFAADLSVAYTILGIRASASINNIGTPVKYSRYEGNKGNNLPTAVRLGIGYGNKWGKHSFDAGIQGDYLIFADEYYGGVGAEYGFDDLVFVRGGYHHNGNSVNTLPQYASVGLGFHFTTIIDINIDAAYMIPVGNSEALNNFKNTFMVSLGFVF